MNGKGMIIAIVSVGAGLGALTATLGGMMLHGQDRLSAAIESNRDDIGALRERMVRLEGRVDMLVEVFTERAE